MPTLIDIEGMVLFSLLTVDGYLKFVIVVMALGFAFFLLFKKQNRLFCYLAIFGALVSLVGVIRLFQPVNNTIMFFRCWVLPTGTTTFFDVASLTFFRIGLMIFILAVFLIFYNKRRTRIRSCNPTIPHPNSPHV